MERSYQTTGAPTLRGVEYWAGDATTKPRLYFSSGANLAAIDAVTGEPVSSFGTNGLVSLRDGVDSGFTTGQLSLSSPPHIFKNLVIIGLRAQESPSFGYAGDTRAWDVHTGKLVWQFHSVPRDGEPGRETWEGDSGKNRSARTSGAS